MKNKIMGSNGRVTIKTVAADAGVSVAAVSKVLRDAYGVSEALRTKVLESIDRLGYRPSTAARGMRGQTYSVGIVMVEMANPFLPEIVAGANDVLATEKYHSMIGVGEAQLKLETALIERMIDTRMDGVLLIAPRLSGEQLARYARQLPMVVIGHHEPQAQAFDTVNSDDQMGGRITVEALVAEGHRRIAMMSLPEKGSTEVDVYRQREIGYVEAMRAAGLGDEIRILRSRERRRLVEADLATALDGPELPSAMFCWSDLHAISLLSGAKSRGIAVPERLAVVGYDNSPVAALSMIGLSSVDQGGRRLGEVAARTLLSRIGGRSAPEHLLLDPVLVRRESF
ncbi:LacI family transcriptional regulator [Limimaricola variabilis]|uniref:LacI family transcriptional regulator n=1 Tax=Limimaricola variabilis TaxID=1492771 RepID=A0ABR6HSL2_9RHOB|nr:LacI family DNA-binding transcriptional regulator [Limimaricola variabilis]MBB3713542.1 LacI family transcriptional regulator [Limimaricola variabilis]